MTRQQTWWCVATLVLFVGGCAEDVPMQELGKLHEAIPKPKEEEKPPEDPFAFTPSPADQTEPAASDQSAPAPSAGYGGYGAVGPKDETYGQGAPIKLKAEVDNPELAKAEGGVGKRGQGYGGGIITEPVRQYFILQDRIKFINMQNTLKIYRAEHNNQNPPTIQEFVDKILTESGVTLPELSPGQFYVYDPSAKDLEGVLLVDQTQRQ
jgi:hypothetical protein